jgi:prophage regulatory protein
MTDRFIREPECEQRSGLSRTTRWRMEQEGRFPPRHRISPGVTAYRESEFVEWMNDPEAYRYQVAVAV